MTLDLWIAGPLYGSSNGSFTGTDPIDIPSAERAGIERDIEETDIPGTKIEATVGKNQFDVKLDGPYIGLRALGLTIGINF